MESAAVSDHATTTAGPPERQPAEPPWAQPSGVHITAVRAILTAPAGTTLPNSLVVHVTDASGNPLQNIPVAWRPVTSADGTVSSGATLTNVNGDASVTWTLGPGTGTQSLTASIASGASVTFTATAN